FKCMKCRSTFVRRDLLLRHDRTVHAKDGGVPLHSDGKRRAGPKARAIATPSKPSIAIDTTTIEQQQMETSGDAVFDVETAAMLVADLQHRAMRDSASPHEGSSSMDYTSTPVEQTVTYPSGAIAIPQAQQMQWDNFMPQ